MYYQLRVVGPTREFIVMDADIDTPQEIADWFIGIREFMDQHDIDVDERYEMVHGINADAITG
jgi:hypothetical protein